MQLKADVWYEFKLSIRVAEDTELEYKPQAMMNVIHEMMGYVNSPISVDNPSVTVHHPLDPDPRVRW